jgi:hypothetical protein
VKIKNKYIAVCCGEIALAFYEKYCWEEYGAFSGSGTEETMNNLLALIAVCKAVLGPVLLLHPPVVVRLLFGTEISGVGMVMGRSPAYA